MEVAHELLELYKVFFQQNQFPQEVIDQASNRIIEIYNNPEALFILINLYSQTPEYNIKLLIALGMKLILSDEVKWLQYHELEQSEKIKSSLLEILHNEKDLQLFRNVIAAVSPILKTEYNLWPEYLELIQMFSTSENNYIFSILMAISMIRKISDNQFLPNIWEFFSNLVLQGLTSDNGDIIIESASLVTSMFRFHATISTNLPELFSKLFLVFQHQMEIDSLICGQLIDDFEKISECFEQVSDDDEMAEGQDFNFINTTEIAQQFLQLIMNPTLNIDSRCLLLKPLISFLFNDPISDKAGILNTLYDVIFVISSSSFVEGDCVESQWNMINCQENLQITMAQCEPEIIRQLILAKGSGGNTKGEIVTYALSLNALAIEFPEILLHDISSCLKFGFACIETNDHTVQEAGFDLLSSLFTRKNDAFFGIQQQFFTDVFQVFSINHSPLISKALECIFHYIESTTLLREFINNLFGVLLQALKVFNTPDIQYRVIDCFSSLVESLADEVAPYAPNIIPVVFHAATQMNKPEECNLKASAIECIGMLIQYYNLLPDIPQIIQTLIACIQSGDEMLISAGFNALSKVVIAQKPELLPALPIALESALKIISSEPEFIDDEENDDKNDVLYDVWNFTMKFISTVSKKIPDSIRPVANKFIQALNKVIDDGINEEIENLAISTSASLIKLCPPDDIINFLRFVLKILDDATTYGSASICFHIIGKFIRKQQEYQLPIPEDIIQVSCNYGLKAITRNLVFQNDSNDSEVNIEFTTQLYYFFEDIARSVPALFPLNDFWKFASKIFNKGNPFEQAEIISVLRVIYESIYANITNIQKKLIIREFVQKLSICDCYNPPYPIAAVRTVVELEPNQLEKYIPQIMGTIDKILETEYEDQLAYNLTMDYVVSLLFSLFRVIFKENFDIQKYMPLMLGIMPSTTESLEAANTYMNLVFLCGEYPNLMSHFAPETVRILSQTFALKEKEWGTINLPTDIAQSMAILLQNLLNSMQQGNEILAVSVPDEMAMQRFQQRFSSFLPA